MFTRILKILLRRGKTPIIHSLVLRGRKSWAKMNGLPEREKKEKRDKRGNANCFAAKIFFSIFLSSRSPDHLSLRVAVCHSLGIYNYGENRELWNTPLGSKGTHLEDADPGSKVFFQQKNTSCTLSLHGLTMFLLPSSLSE